ncbi:hypothetical protein ACIP98_27585 [Streptomyces sp. NPDC088354]|uniref:hypothetical protein n=1 Tax=Streptomyces sp. NPDC088354 TaxID=3365856 RepID=UPI00380B0570
MGGTPVPGEPGAGRTTRNAGGASRTPPAVEGRVHAAGGMPTTAMPDRHQCWAMLPPEVRQQLEHDSGALLEWWATRLTGTGDEAVTFGRFAFRVAERVAGRRGGTGYRVRTLLLDPASFHEQAFRGSPGGSGGAGVPSARNSATGAAASLLSRHRPDGAAHGPVPEPAAPAEPELTQEARDFLGNLPPAVQRYLQQPFLTEDRRVTAGWYYEETVHGGFTETAVWCHLVGARTVAFASGTRWLPAGAPPARATWSVVCRRAAVRRPGR